MILEVNGVSYEFFTGMSVNIRMDALCREFKFDATKTGLSVIPFKGGESCRVLDKGDLILTGHIERVDVNYTSSSHTISVSGRDNTGDLIDSTLRSNTDYRPPITLKRAAELAIKDIGAKIKVIDTANPDAFKVATDMITPEPGERVFEFIEKLAKKRKVLLSSTPHGNLLISRASKERSTGSIKNVLGADDNNVLSASVSYDMTARFYKYTFTSQLNLAALTNAGITIPAHIANQRGYAIDPSVRESRQLAIQPESSLAAKDNTARAEWEANVRKSRGRLYSCEVLGFREAPDGALWAVNKLIHVQDDFADINGFMRITSVAFNLDSNRGSTTTLTLMPPNAFELSLSEPKKVTIGAELTQ